MNLGGDGGLLCGFELGLEGSELLPGLGLHPFDLLLGLLVEGLLVEGSLLDRLLGLYGRLWRVGEEFLLGLYVRIRNGGYGVGRDRRWFQTGLRAVKERVHCSH